MDLGSFVSIRRISPRVGAVCLRAEEGEEEELSLLGPWTLSLSKPGTHYWYYRTSHTIIIHNQTKVSNMAGHLAFSYTTA